MELSKRQRRLLANQIAVAQGMRRAAFYTYLNDNLETSQEVYEAGRAVAADIRHRRETGRHIYARAV